jgi:hydrogenase large subunit
MAERIVINPLTRISGFMEAQADIQDNVVTDAKTEGILFRGFEQMLKGRHPFDAVYYTQRICGICSTAHSVASTLALENALGIAVTEQGKYLRDIMHGCEYLQNHIRHFYQFTIPDYVRLPEKLQLFETTNSDFRLPVQESDRIIKNYFESLEASRDAHQMLAVLGGKIPHNHGVFPGGASSEATAAKIIKMKSLLQKITDFINNKMIPDVCSIARYYNDYYKMGGGYGNFLSYGVFNGYKDLGTLYVDPLTFTDGNISAFDQNNITENIDYSWYKDRLSTYTPNQTIPEPDPQKESGYSWIRAARYRGLAYEVGPLARQWLSGEYRNGVSAMDRTIARVLEAKKVAEIVGILLDNLIPGTDVQKIYEVPDSAEGSGLVDTTRGALGHWLKIENRVISFYQIITPTVWNMSTQTKNLKGTGEQALIGTRIRDINNPVELGIILRSFDPCISCGAHVYIGGEYYKMLKVVP